MSTETSNFLKHFSDVFEKLISFTLVPINRLLPMTTRWCGFIKPDGYFCSRHALADSPFCRQHNQCLSDKFLDFKQFLEYKNVMYRESDRAQWALKNNVRLTHFNQGYCAVQNEWVTNYPHKPFIFDIVIKKILIGYLLEQYSHVYR